MCGHGGEKTPDPLAVGEVMKKERNLSNFFSKYLEALIKYEPGNADAIMTRTGDYYYFT